jgi:Do/DeqQ family serine protease
MPQRLLITLLLCALTTPLIGTASAAMPALDSQGKPLPTLAPMIERVTPAVVNISTRGQEKIAGNPLLQDPIFRRFFNLPQQPSHRDTQSLGSGVIIDADNGYILTNSHVIDKAIEITVTLQDGRRLNATLVGADPEADVAVIQVPNENLSALKLADSDQLRVGDFVVAIGNPFGLGQTVTSGIVSALGRSGLGIEGYEDFIQTDASINPGNSGGALVNLRGELVGINTAIIAPGGGNVGIGFAIPTNMSQQIMAQLVKYGEVKRGKLGVSAQNLTPELAHAFGIEGTSGAVVVQLTPDSPAASAGLQIGDVIISVNGHATDSAFDIRNQLGLLRIGDTAKLQILRGKKKLTIKAEIADPEPNKVEGKQFDARLDGTVFSRIEEGSPLYGQIDGVLVVETQQNSPSWRAGLRKGDVVVSANRRTVTDFTTLTDALKQSRRGILLNVIRGSSALFILIQ